MTLTVTDNSGNTATATATITVQDKTAPVINANTPLTLTLDATGNVTLSVSDVENGSTDNCSISTKVLSKTSFTCANVGSNTVTYTVTDASGNASTTNISVTVQDKTAPVLSVNSTVTLSLDATGKATLTVAAVEKAPGSKDNCGITSQVLSKTAFDCNDIGNNTVTYTVSDASGNTSTAVITVTVQDVAAPTAKAKNVTLTLNAIGSATLAASDVDNGSTDNCGIKTLSISKTAFDCTYIGTTNVVT